MSDVHHIVGFDGLGVTLEPSPINYFPDKPEVVVRRFIRTKNDNPIFWVDYIIKDDALMIISIQAEPEYRDGKWLEYINFDEARKASIFEDGYQKMGKFSKTFWLGVNDNPNFQTLLEKRDHLSKSGLMVDSEIYLKGNERLNVPDQFHDTRNPFPTDQTNS